MANAITRHIPNTITCLNLFSGCAACVMAFEANYVWAAFFILLSSVFDFLDGLIARLLKAYSPLGKELDSLADVVSFGVAPALMVFSLYKEVYYPQFLAGMAAYVPYVAFLIAVFSALRLAKFNIDERQTGSFIGLPVPAHALFWASLIVGSHSFLTSPHFNAVYLALPVVLFSGLLVSEIPMFALKFKNLSWAGNKTAFIFILTCIPLLVFLRVSGLAACIVWYILLSLFTKGKNH
ncbi:MAG: CDP-diacylglycerol--serine O-phosphatidyltransferase [Mediterranea sp.]|jgi:CDP-diacylglycerol--serine O-phosphatidyltransferase|nr:CDP-diacylglycerol--serine O-phosphatidyltransferase [Mediterranea sp.]